MDRRSLLLQGSLRQGWQPWVNIYFYCPGTRLALQGQFSKASVLFWGGGRGSGFKAQGASAQLGWQWLAHCQCSGTKSENGFFFGIGAWVQRQPVPRNHVLVGKRALPSDKLAQRLAGLRTHVYNKKCMWPQSVFGRNTRSATDKQTGQASTRMCAHACTRS